jgi:3-oxoacyl-[acyl-carrier-protein] synthase I
VSLPGDRALSILGTGLVCSVGLSVPAACAAIRAGVTNPTESRFMDSNGEWIVVHSVPLPHPWAAKLGKMAAAAVSECVQALPADQLAVTPLILCLSERLDATAQAQLEIDIFAQIEAELGARFAPQSAVVARGRLGIGQSLVHARQLIYEGGAPAVIIAATDSLLTWPTLSEYLREGRLLTPDNSNGFLPGEAAAAVLVGAGTSGRVLCAGVGMATEPASIGSEAPLRGDGLVAAIRAALAQAGCAMHDMDLRITDLSGEQYYFKEATLAVTRLLRARKAEFDLWHPAECIGETGVASGIVAMVLADTALRRSYAPGPNVLTHLSADNGDRIAAVLRYEGRS